MTVNKPSGIKRLNYVLAATAPASRSVKSGAQRRLSAILDVDQLAMRVYLRAAVASPPAPKPVQLGRLDALLKRQRRGPKWVPR